MILNNWMRLRRLGSAALLCALAAPMVGSRAAIPASRLPRLVLWAWERPEHLESINPKTTAVAFLSQTLFLTKDDVIVRPRMQPLIVPPGTRLISVVRIEAAPNPKLSDVQRAHLVDAIAVAVDVSRVVGLQIDFDATSSQHEFYAALLRELRERVTVPISITALASWCMGDNWLSSLPVDEAVPMLFRMGAGQREAELFLETRGITAPLCTASVGVSTDEPRWNLAEGKRVYVFHPRAWSAAAVAEVENEVRSQVSGSKQ